MQEFIKKYVCHCNTCKCSKGFRFKKQSVLWPLLIFDQRWQDISMDFVTGISAVKGANVIWNIVDHFSKERHHIAINKKIDAEKLSFCASRLETSWSPQIYHIGLWYLVCQQLLEILVQKTRYQRMVVYHMVP